MSRVLFSIAVGAAAAFALPAQATIAPFAAISTTNSSPNMKLLRTTVGPVTTYTLGTQSNATLNNSLFGGVSVYFSYLQSTLGGGMNSVKANFTFLATSVNTPFSDNGTDKLGGFTGTFSIISTVAFTTPMGFFHDVGTNLLSATIEPFSGAMFSGTHGGTTGSTQDSTAVGNNITYTSDILDFSETENRDFSLTFASLLPALGTTGSGATLRIKNFSTSASGLFSSDPAPLVEGVPETATWMMLLAGFGAIGTVMRAGRRQQHSLIG